MFFLGILEIGLIQASVASFIVGISPVFTKKVVNECATGYKYSSLYQLSAALASSADKASIPDKLIFVLSAASFYMYAMFLYFNTSLTMLGPIMMERVTAGIVMSGLLLATVVLWRLFINKCDSMSHLIISFVMGAFGMLIFFQNALLFGDANVNILSVPLLQTGLPVCAPTGP